MVNKNNDSYDIHVLLDTNSISCKNSIIDELSFKNDNKTYWLTEEDLKERMEKNNKYDSNFYSRVTNIGTFDESTSTLYLKEDISTDNGDFRYLCSYYKFFICRSLFDNRK